MQFLLVVKPIFIVFQRNQACKNMNGCLNSLSQEYPTVKFCKIRASDSKLSIKFVSIAITNVFWLQSTLSEN